MTAQDTNKELKVAEVERIKEMERKIQEDPMAMSLLVVYAQSLEQTKRVKKELVKANDLEPGQMAS